LYVDRTLKLPEFVIIFQQLALLEHSGATMDNASRAMDIVMGDKTAMIAVMR